MRSCEQTSGLNVLEHGYQVDRRFKDLTGPRELEWRLPDWFTELGDRLLALCPPPEVMSTYHIYHDVGKPFCLTIDADGRRHFPNHATVSSAIWRASGGDERIARLMQHDMDFHLMKPSEAESYPHLDLAPALLITALCEIHANAQMFGGIKSDSFCIKWKRLSKIGNRIIPLILKEQP
jgi:hypothetical protein